MSSGESIGRILYTVDLDYSVDAPADFVFLIAAAITPQQRVVSEHLEGVPGASVQRSSDGDSDRLIRASAGAGRFQVHYDALVEVSHHLAWPEELGERRVGDLPEQTLVYLRPSRYCQSDRLQKLALWEFGQVAPGYSRVKAIEEWVRKRTHFQPGASRSDTSALETLTDHAGVCRDFAHLMIALCRAMSIPARLVTGVDFGADPALGPPDFHAYVEAFLDDRWYLFDPTGISPTTGLIRIGTGRDAADVAFATMFGPVRSGMPILTFTAVPDARGRGTPQPTSLAVSTAGPEGSGQIPDAPDPTRWLESSAAGLNHRAVVAAAPA